MIKKKMNRKLNKNKVSETTIKRASRANENQKQNLVEYMEYNLDFALDRFEGNDATIRKEGWNSLGTKLNQLGGAIKSGPQWKKFWFDIRHYVKEKSKQSGRILTPLEERILAICKLEKNHVKEHDSSADDEDEVEIQSSDDLENSKNSFISIAETVQTQRSRKFAETSKPSTQIPIQSVKQSREQKLEEYLTKAYEIEERKIQIQKEKLHLKKIELQLMEREQELKAKQLLIKEETLNFKRRQLEVIEEGRKRLKVNTKGLYVQRMK